MGWGVILLSRVATKYAVRILGLYGDGVGVFEGLHIFPWHQVVQSNGHPGSPTTYAHGTSATCNGSGNGAAEETITLLTSTPSRPRG